jgi:urocanate hydratase
MTATIMTEPWLTVRRGDAPLVVSFPYTGLDLPADCTMGLVSAELGRYDADWYIDRLYAFAGDRTLEVDETLCVQSGKPVGVFCTSPEAPRVLIANSNLVPHWATLDYFNETRSQRPYDVRPDDRGLLDLYRLARDRAGHL